MEKNEYFIREPKTLPPVESTRWLKRSKNFAEKLCNITARKPPSTALILIKNFTVENFFLFDVYELFTAAINNEERNLQLKHSKSA